MTSPFDRNGHHLPPADSGAARPLGLVVGGSLTGGVEARLDGDVSIEDVKAGTFVTIQGLRQRFFGVVTDLALGSADPRLKHSPPGLGDAFLAEALGGTVAYGSATILPQLTLPAALGAAEAPAAAKTIPGHFARVFAASPADVAQVFGGEDGGHFWIGSPLDMEAKVCLNLDELVKRSIGVFGKSGTGKTFLTRLLLVGILQGGKASSLIFDMHSEYGAGGADSDKGTRVKGLKELFGDKVSTFTLDEAHSRRRNSFPDEVVRIGYQEIEPEDVELLRETLNLSDVAASAAYNLQQRFGQREWLREFINLQGRSAVTDLAGEIQVNSSALSALHSRLSRLKRFAFLTEQAGQDTAARMVEHLERGKHVVLEFGQYGDNLTAYILVSNLLTRRIHNRYVELKDAALGGQGREPRPLVIVIEEAHKFLNPSVAAQTIFGVIARELRKYNVTLMVIDQRPGAIDTEVLSQVGTRLTCLLDNEHDIDAALAGMPGGRQLRSVLARLEPKQQALIFGHAVPMPVVIHTREYGSAESYELLRAGARRQPSSGAADARPGETNAERLKREIDELF